MPKIYTIPVFPLEQVLYPNEQLPLHIFEQRYRDMVAYCLETDSPFGVLLSKDGKIARIGCTARIDQVVTTYEDGRMDILVRGEKRFRVDGLDESESYLVANVEDIEEPDEPLRIDLRERVITQHMRLLELAGRKVRPTIYQDVEGISFFIAHNVGLNPEQKQEILELLTENERIHYLTEHLEMLIPRVEQFEDVRKRVQSNGHFKDYPEEE